MRVDLANAKPPSVASALPNRVRWNLAVASHLEHSARRNLKESSDDEFVNEWFEAGKIRCGGDWQLA
jgi:hypothetical protein